MTDPISGGDGWAQAVVEGVAEGEQVRPAGSPPNTPSTDEPRVSAPESEDHEVDPAVEIVELDVLDPADEAQESGSAEEVGGAEVEAEEAELMDDQLDQVEDVVEDSTDGSDSAEAVDSGAGVDSATDTDSTSGDDEVDVTVEDLVADLERVSSERDQYLEASRRLQAEFENYKKQVVKREATARDRANDNLIGELLPVLDAFDGAVANGAEDVAPMRGAMLDALAKQGLERIDPPDATFDPTFHEAVMHEDDGDVTDGPVVSEVLRAGYSWKGRVLRPAMVKTRG